MSKPRLEGKVAIVTGGASGIGAETVRLFSENGAFVVAADVQDELGHHLVASIGSDKVSYRHCDVRDEKQVEETVSFTLEKYGRLDIMFSNAGIMGSGSVILDLDLNSFDNILAVNVRGVAATIKHAARAMVANKIRGSIICTASIAGLVGGSGTHGYTTSKHAVIGLVRSACSELGAFGIRVNCVSPYVTATAMSCTTLNMEADEVEATGYDYSNLKGITLKASHIAEAALLEGKVAIVTGGASGIGAETVRLFSENGAFVVAADIQDELGHQLVASIGSEKVSYRHCDVRDEKQVEETVNFALEKYGRLDIMFSNAGTVDSGSGILNLDLCEFDNIMAVNVRGVAATIKHAARAMVANNVRGSIICTASVAGLVADCSTHASTTSKHAVIGLVRTACNELGAFGIRVNCVSPHAVATPLTCTALSMEADEVEATGCDRSNLKGVILKARHIAEAALFLASDDSVYISGHNLVVDGGFIASKSCFPRDALIK
ncbi:hypothetical protein L6164_034830 [Bauhinia variegata]|uniref:Uncharacterized protein n=1 Tax=Bauhinia variegata TaxID=167791 RepID=A0ACB9KWC0_BAUVA|nr:hypothetical protein L6164_034830 [Bauhinia variegata]